jgi:hypothetical protein
MKCHKPAHAYRIVDRARIYLCDDHMLDEDTSVCVENQASPSATAIVKLALKRGWERIAALKSKSEKKSLPSG